MCAVLMFCVSLASVERTRIWPGLFWFCLPNFSRITVRMCFSCPPLVKTCSIKVIYFIILLFLFIFLVSFKIVALQFATCKSPIRTKTCSKVSVWALSNAGKLFQFSFSVKRNWKPSFQRNAYAPEVVNSESLPFQVALQPSTMVEAFAGKWKLENSEKFDDYLKELGKLSWHWHCCCEEGNFFKTMAKSSATQRFWLTSAIAETANVWDACQEITEQWDHSQNVVILLPSPDVQQETAPYLSKARGKTNFVTGRIALV